MSIVKNTMSRRLRLTALIVLSVAVAVIAVSTPAAAGQDETLPETSFDGMTLVKSSKSSFVYKKADADFSLYEEVRILGCQVAFRKDWARDFNRNQGPSVSSNKVSERDMEKIKTAVAELFDEVFQSELAKSESYTIVSQPSAKTLLIRPAIINLDVYAPVLDPAVRTRVQSAGEGTLYLELYDGVSGEILARIVDRSRDPDRHFSQWATRAFNRAVAERIMKEWAVQLREGFDRAHGGEIKAQESQD